MLLKYCFILGLLFGSSIAFLFIGNNTTDTFEVTREEYNDYIDLTRLTGYKYENRDVIEFKKFCHPALKKTADRAFTTAYIEINSKNKCAVYEGSSSKELDELKQNSSSINFEAITNRVLSYFLAKKQATDKHNSCNEILFVPIFRPYCVGVDTVGHLNVKLVYDYFDLKNFSLFLFGLSLYFLSKKLSRNDLFQYCTGMSLGVAGSLLLVLILLSRYIPKKKWAVATAVSSTTFSAFAGKWLFSHFYLLADEYQQYLLYYVVCSAFVSGIYLYYRGPLENERALNIIEYMLKGIAIYIVYASTAFKEIPFMIGIFMSVWIIFIYLFRKLAPCLTVFTAVRFRYFPPKKRLLTNEEYVQQGNAYTAKALAELRDYCKSPDCNAWKVLSRVRRPDRFAQFIDNGYTGVTEDEIADYENYQVNNDLIDEDDDNGDEVELNDSYMM